MIPRRYFVHLPAELVVQINALATARNTTTDDLLTECIKVGLIAAKVHADGGRVLLERDGATTMLEWET